MKIHKVSKKQFLPTESSLHIIDTKGKYFLSYENETTRMASVLWDDLEFIKKMGSLERKGTKEMLSYALKYNIPCWEIERHKIRHTLENPTFYKLSEESRLRFKKDIDRGDFIVCQFID